MGNKILEEIKAIDKDVEAIRKIAQRDNIHRDVLRYLLRGKMYAEIYRSVLVDILEE